MTPIAQVPRDLTPAESARAFFGAELRHWRVLRGLSQVELGGLVHVSGGEISKVEGATRWPTARLSRCLDDALGAGGIFARLWPLVERERTARTDPMAGIGNDLDFALFIDQSGRVWANAGRRRFILGTLGIAGSRALPFSAEGHAAALDPLLTETIRAMWPTAAFGETDSGLDLTFPSFGIYDGARLSVTDWTDQQQLSDVRRSGGMLVTIDEAAAEVRLLDARLATTREDGPRSPGGIPTAYRLDAFTAGIVMAATNLDQALQADDAALSRARRRLVQYGRSESSEVGREAARELGAVSQAWLGSRFCAGHIGRHLREIAGRPAFWTREQRGDEASTWLFFTHKHQYLRKTVDMFGMGLSRTFCIPEDVVAGTSKPDRVLLFLTLALMESSGIRAVLSADPAYAQVEGFVLSDEKAVLANWVRAEGLWHVDATGARSVVTDFDAAIHDADTRNVLGHQDSADRLRALAEYFGLDWTWLARRCAEFSDHGFARLVSPHSRLLGLDGLEQAVSFVRALAA